MGKYRTLSESNQYYLPKHTYLTCIHYALQYRDWKAVDELTSTLREMCPEDPTRYDYSLFGLGISGDKI